ncbi:MAG TPA: RNA polymerase Rpb4 family protein [Methanosarcinales archaeon]|nr:MAG: RNA polymerase Rpb4 family protein [Methanosarcinales archaeon]HDN66148.1 RNA polymerase Rpb4 family protein [Methanosarcinales archaeon]
MIVKKVINEELLTISEAKELLDRIKEDRADEDEELGYELKKAIRHIDAFSKNDAEQSRTLVANLLELGNMKPEIAIRIADILPKTRDELRSIYAKERFILTTEDLDQMLDIVADVA